MSITNVAVAGGTGTLGNTVVDALVSAGFNVTVLTRSESSSTTKFPPTVKIAQVDYTSHSSLISALEGHQAVVSLLNGPAIDLQIGLTDAAIDAGVARFIPSEFGSDTLNPRAKIIPVFKSKVATQEHLRAKSHTNPGFTYTFVLNGPFLDLCIKWGLLVDAKNRRATIFDGGDRQISVTRTADVGKAVAGVLKHPEETKNRGVYIQGAQITQNELLRTGEKITGNTWSVEHQSSEAVGSLGWAEMSKQEPNHHTIFLCLLKAVIFGNGFGSDFGDKVENGLVGVKGMTRSEVEEELRKWVV